MPQGGPNVWACDMRVHTYSHLGRWPPGEGTQTQSLAPSSSPSQGWVESLQRP